jgi:26S proteasome regulatory subunit (ATPase 3-interacting protein)
VDISANLKGAVPKTATQKILLALSEKGELTQKTYGIVFLFSRFLILSPIYVYIYAHM